MNAKIPTPIVDKNGKLTTVHKRADDSNKGSNRISSINPARPAEPENNAYIAPETESMKKLVNYDGVVQSYGELLEGLQPLGIRRALSEGDSQARWGAIHSDDSSVSTVIPYQVAKDSGLPDLTTPIERARDDLALAQRKLEKSSNGPYVLNTRPDLVAKQEKVKTLEAELLGLQKDKHREKVSRMNRAEKTEYMESIYGMDNAAAQVFVEDDDISVVRELAKSESRKYLDRDARSALLKHSDEEVRRNFITGNSNLSVFQLFEAAERDASESVRSTAREQIAAKGYEAYRKDDGVLVINSINQ
jgi:hypothetical protein